MIALTTRKVPRWPEPGGNDGRWIYVELLLDGRHRIGGYVNVLHAGNAARDWLTHELCDELTALQAIERRARTPKGYAVRMICALKSAVLLAGTSGATRRLTPVGTRALSRSRSREHMTDERAARYISAPEAARYLGVSTRTFYDHVRSGVAFVRIGSRVLFDAADLDAWAASRKQAPPEPVAPPVEPSRRGQVRALLKMARTQREVSPEPTYPKGTACAHLKRLREQGKTK